MTFFQKLKKAHFQKAPPVIPYTSPHILPQSMRVSPILVRVALKKAILLGQAQNHVIHLQRF